MPGLAIALIEDDRVTYVRGYGDAGGGRRMTADIPMPIRSTTKTFTAVAVLQLVEQGRIDLDAPVSTYLPWSASRISKLTTPSRSVTCSSNTSGLSDPAYNRVLDPYTSLEGAVRELQRVHGLPFELRIVSPPNQRRESQVPLFVDDGTQRERVMAETLVRQQPCRAPSPGRESPKPRWRTA
jgi:CubicO group peptidase (beta-lactamase class C family)